MRHGGFRMGERQYIRCVDGVKDGKPRSTGHVASTQRGNAGGLRRPRIRLDVGDVNAKLLLNRGPGAIGGTHADEQAGICLVVEGGVGCDNDGHTAAEFIGTGRTSQLELPARIVDQLVSVTFRCGVNNSDFPNHGACRRILVDRIAGQEEIGGEELAWFEGLESQEIALLGPAGSRRAGAAGSVMRAARLPAKIWQQHFFLDFGSCMAVVRIGGSR